VTTSRAGKPIVIADYDPTWPARFEAECDRIVAACGPDVFVAIEHVGSTAVPGLPAKPIIDMMPGVRSLADVTPGRVRRLEGIGWEYVPEYERDDPRWGDGMPDRRYFRKDERGERAFHMHLVEAGSEFWTTHLLFRDWLRAHPEDMRAYAEVKRCIAREYNTLPEGSRNVNLDYTENKSDFIASVMAKARAATTSAG
jgi:GrpB-like predicted nucleotidyltransferase (UPF0157 family)